MCLLYVESIILILCRILVEFAKDNRSRRDDDRGYSGGGGGG